MDSALPSCLSSRQRAHISGSTSSESQVLQKCDIGPCLPFRLHSLPHTHYTDTVPVSWRPHRRCDQGEGRRWLLPNLKSKMHQCLPCGRGGVRSGQQPKGGTLPQSGFKLGNTHGSQAQGLLPIRPHLTQCSSLPTVLGGGGNVLPCGSPLPGRPFTFEDSWYPAAGPSTGFLYLGIGIDPSLVGLPAPSSQL